MAKPIKIKQVTLHQAVAMGGVINTEKTLSRAKTPKIQSMEWTNDGLIIVSSGHRAIIPQSNVAIALVDEAAE